MVRVWGFGLISTSRQTRVCSDKSLADYKSGCFVTERRFLTLLGIEAIAGGSFGREC